MNKPRVDWRERLGCEQITSHDGLQIYVLPTVDGHRVNSLGELGDFIQEAVEAERERIESRIGFLRQWLNEKPADLLVTNEAIKLWLELNSPIIKERIKSR